MQVKTYEIRERSRRNPISVAAAADFRLERSSEKRDPGFLISNKAVSPYCIDPEKEEVLLTELPDDVDIASFPFVYEAQYIHAQRVHTLGMNDFIALTQELDRPTSVMLLHSTGRCGSTLLTRALSSIGGVNTFSEADIFTQLAMAGRSPSASTREAFACLHDSCLRFFTRGQADLFVFKFRSVVCEHADYLASVLPGATSIFLYRRAIDVARSYARVTNRPLSTWELSETERRAWSTLVPLIRDLSYPMDGYDLMAAMWAGPVIRYLHTYPEGIWHGALNYADLLQDRSAALDALLSHFQLEPALAGMATSVFDTHSQAGSHLAPDRLDLDASLEGELTSPEFPERISRSLHRIDKRLDSEMILPGNFRDRMGLPL